MRAAHAPGPRPVFGSAVGCLAVGSLFTGEFKALEQELGQGEGEAGVLKWPLT